MNFIDLLRGCVAALDLQAAHAVHNDLSALLEAHVLLHDVVDVAEHRARTRAQDERPVRGHEDLAAGGAEAQVATHRPGRLGGIGLVVGLCKAQHGTA